MICARCGHDLNHHADKLIYPTGSDEEHLLGGIVEEVYACPACGTGASRRSAS